MQLDALHFLRQLAVQRPESGVVCSDLVDVFDDVAEGEAFWGVGRVPGVEVVKCEGGKGVEVRYPSVVASPEVLLPFLRARLEEQGVKFVRGTVHELKELEKFGGDVVINACGAGAATLGGVRDGKMVEDRTYTVLVRSGFEGSFVRRGEGGRYTYVFGRGDGTVVVGGVSEGVGEEMRGVEEVRGEVSSSLCCWVGVGFCANDGISVDEEGQ